MFLRVEFRAYCDRSINSGAGRKPLAIRRLAINKYGASPFADVPGADDFRDARLTYGDAPVQAAWSYQSTVIMSLQQQRKSHHVWQNSADCAM